MSIFISVTFWGYLSLAREFNAKRLYKIPTERLPDRLSYIFCGLYFGIFCSLINNALHYITHHIKSYIFYRPGKLFSRVHSLIQKLIHWRSTGKLELSLG